MKFHELVLATVDSEGGISFELREGQGTFLKRDDIAVLLGVKASDVPAPRDVFPDVAVDSDGDLTLDFTYTRLETVQAIEEAWNAMVEQIEADAPVAKRKAWVVDFNAKCDG